MQQTKIESLIEALINVVIGFCIQCTTSAFLLPLLGVEISVSQNLILGIGMTVVSVARQYVLRRWAQGHLRKTKDYFVSLIMKGEGHANKG